MEIPEILTDPRFLEVARMLKEKRATKEAATRQGEPPPDDEATRAVQAKISLRMKQRKTKQRR